MKKLIIFSLLSLNYIHLSKYSYAQGNLQFNQVKLIGSTPETVPTGKVWKIESAVLSLQNGIRVPPRFIVGNDTIVLGYDSYTTTELENVVSVKLEWKGNNFLGGSSTCSGTACTTNLPCNGSSSVSLNVGGVSQGSTILNDNISFSNVPSANSGTYINLGTMTLPSQGNNVVNNWTLFFTPIGVQPCLPTYTSTTWGYNYTFRVTFLMSNGNAISYVVTKSAGNCGGAPQQSIVNPTIATETRSRAFVTTQFPIWVPQNTILKTLSNVSRLSVIEFNVVP
jgi:hypothetical protein